MVLLAVFLIGFAKQIEARKSLFESKILGDDGRRHPLSTLGAERFFFFLTRMTSRG